MIEIEKPRFESEDTNERVVELKRYLDRLADDLNYVFDVMTAEREDGKRAGRND